jgi:acyl-CoA synthetase (AMP-forming)/AMP-acid ligase II
MPVGNTSGENMTRLPDSWGNLTLQSLLEKSAIEAPARIVLRDCPLREQWNGTEPRNLNTDTLLRAVRFVAAQLLTLGLQRGERVLLLLPNSVESYISVLACHYAGAVPAIAPIDETVDVLRACAERCEAAVVLTCARVGEMALGEKARLVAAKALCVRGIAGFGLNLVDGIVSLEGWSDEDIDPLPEIVRDQSDDALITFAKEAEGVVAMIRTEGQLIAEALALHSVLRLDGRRGLISLMQPGASATLAASFTLPLYTGASVRLLGPYDRDALEQVFTAEPTAFLFAPDHFVASLRAEMVRPGLFSNSAGMLALARIASPMQSILPPGPFKGALVFDFAERGLMTRLAWPADGQLDLPHRYDHPMESVLPEDVPMLAWAENGITGFGAPRIIRKGSKVAEKAA